MDNKENDVTNEEYTFDFGFDDLGEEPRPNEQDNLKNGVYSDDDGNIYFPSNEEYTFDFKLDESEEEPISIEQDNSKNGVYSDDDGNIFFPLNEKSLDSTDTDESTNKKESKAIQTPILDKYHHDFKHLYNEDENSNKTKYKLNKNDSKKFINSKFFKSILALSIAGTVIAGGTLFVHKRINKVREQRYNHVVEYFGENSDEKLLLDYIAVARNLDKLDLYKYQVTENLNFSFDSEELYSVENLNNLIDKFKSLKEYSKNDLDAGYDFIKLVCLLKSQEGKLNDYIYKVGSEIAHDKITIATKSVAAELVGLKDFDINRLILYRTNQGHYEYILYYFDDNKEIWRWDLTNIFYFTPKLIRNGVNDMIKVDSEEIKKSNPYDTDLYIMLTNALDRAAKLNEENDDKNLHDDKYVGNRIFWFQLPNDVKELLKDNNPSLYDSFLNSRII